MTVTDQTAKKRIEAPAVAEDADWAARARKVAPVAAAAADRIEELREIPEDVMAALHGEELFRMFLPRSLGGGEATPLQFMEVLEALAAADASTAWCVGQGVGCTFAAAYLDPDIAREIFGPADAVLAWGPPEPKAKAIAVDGGYRVTGHWRFASGSRGAGWLGGHTPICDADGTPRRSASGGLVLRTMLFPKASARIDDVWQVIGLRGTGSDDYAVEDLFVPDPYTTWRENDADRREDGPLYRIPLIPLYGMGFAGVALGIARAAMDDFKDLAAVKVASGSSTVMRENAVVQSQYAQAEARVRSGHAFLKEMIEDFWATLCAGDEPTLHQRGLLRVAITSAMNQAREAVNFAYQSAGTNAIFESNPFERRFRDMHTVAQQGQAHVSNFEPAGMALLGLTPTGHRV